MKRRHDPEHWMRSGRMRAIRGRLSRLYGEIESLRKIQEHLEGELDRAANPGETGSPEMLQKALGEIIRKIDKIEAKIRRLKP